MQRLYLLSSTVTIFILLLAACTPPLAATPTATPTSENEPTLTPVPPTKTPTPTPTFTPSPTVTAIPTQADFDLTSRAFTQQGKIPVKYTCNGDDASPPLAWNDPPQGTQSFVIFLDDPDMRMGWTHWVLFNIPAETRSLPESILPVSQLVDGSRQGMNSYGKIGYDGPCPATGTHRYFFKIYALDILLNLPSGITKSEVIVAMNGHVLRQAELMGTYR